MADSPDFKELLRVLNEKQAEYLIVGDYAVMKYTEPRFTKDLDATQAPRELFILLARKVTLSTPAKVPSHFCPNQLFRPR